MDNMKMADSCAAGLVTGGGTREGMAVMGRYHVECVSPAKGYRAKYVRLRDQREIALSMGFPTAELDAAIAKIPMRTAWVEDFDNLVTNVGKDDFLDKYLKGSAYTQTIRMGLKGTGSAAAGDTQASHAGWLEQGLANAPTYTGNRKDVTMNSASGQASSSPTQAFAITSTGTVHGCFINNGGSATKDNTTGVLFSAGDFSASRAVINGDTLNVTYTLTLT